jgi:hypothetical protein
VPEEKMNRGRPRGGNRLFWVAAAILAVVLLLAFFSFHSRKGAVAKKVVDTDIEGVDLTYYDFDKNNQKKLEIRCRQSQKKGDDQLLMKGVQATIFDTDKHEDDIHVTAEAGTVSNNFYDFFIHGRAHIFSSNFSLLSSPARKR